MSLLWLAWLSATLALALSTSPAEVRSLLESYQVHDDDGASGVRTDGLQHSAEVDCAAQAAEHSTHPSQLLDQEQDVSACRYASILHTALIPVVVDAVPALEC
jgi:hypothetical protein